MSAGCAIKKQERRRRYGRKRPINPLMTFMPFFPVSYSTPFRILQRFSFSYSDFFKYYAIGLLFLPASSWSCHRAAQIAVGSCVFTACDAGYGWKVFSFLLFIWILAGGVTLERKQDWNCDNKPAVRLFELIQEQQRQWYTQLHYEALQKSKLKLKSVWVCFPQRNVNFGIWKKLQKQKMKTKTKSVEVGS